MYFSLFTAKRQPRICKPPIEVDDSEIKGKRTL